MLSRRVGLFTRLFCGCISLWHRSKKIFITLWFVVCYRFIVGAGVSCDWLRYFSVMVSA